jgi:hypothetical protein
VLSVDHRDVSNVDVRHDIWYAVVLAQGSNGDTVRAIAVHVLDEGVGGVGLEGDAVITIDDGGVSDDDVVGSISVPCREDTDKIRLLSPHSERAPKLTSIGVGSGSANIRAQALHVDVLEGNVARLEDDRVPERGVGDRDALNDDVGSSSNGERNWSSEHP